MFLFPVYEAGKCQTVRRHPLEGTSHPLLQAVMRCNVDVKFMGRGLSQELLDTLDELTAELSEEPKPKKKRLSTKTQIKADRLAGMFAIRPTDSQSRFKAIVIQLLLDTIRDQLDAQHYVGEYATKKFEVAKDLLPELYKGLLRLQTERQAAVNVPTVLDAPHQIDGLEPAVSSVAQAVEAAPALAVDAPVVVKSTAQTRQVRARQTLMRLATSMQRCLNKSNGEMTFHILFGSKAFLTFATHTMFSKFPTWAVLACQREAAAALAETYPEATVLALHNDSTEQPDVEAASLHESIIQTASLHLGEEEGFAEESGSARKT